MNRIYHSYVLTALSCCETNRNELGTRDDDGNDDETSYQCSCYIKFLINIGGLITHRDTLKKSSKEDRCESLVCKSLRNLFGIIGILIPTMNASKTE